jgi:hypothetical protein
MPERRRASPLTVKEMIKTFSISALFFMSFGLLLATHSLPGLA